MQTRVYIVRHGETENNVLHRFQGCTDVPLNERGLNQAKCLRKPMLKINLDRIYASPYLRTMQTAEQVQCDRAIEIVKVPGLCEINCGQWEGLNGQEIEERWPGQLKLWQYEPDKLAMQDGETFKQVQDRAIAAFIDIVKREKGGTVAIVSHMLTIQLIMGKLLNIPISEVWNMNRLENTSVTTMDVWENGDFEIIKWGDDSHLIPELKNEYVRIAGFKQKTYDVAYDVSVVEGRHHYPQLIALQNA